MDDLDAPIVIIGSGIAGLSAAIYTGRAGRDPLVIKGSEPGGQLTLTTDVANYPGFPNGINGSELIQRMTDQAIKFGASFENRIVTGVSKNQSAFELQLSNGNIRRAASVIVASGASARTLGIPGEDKLMGYGVSTCATCDGAFFRGEDMLVVGGGDAALEEASFLTKFAETVHLIHRRDEFRAEQYWVDTIQKHIEDEIVKLHLNTEAVEIHGTQANGLSGVSVVKNPNGHPSKRIESPETTEHHIDVKACFMAIGHVPNTNFLEDTPVEIDESGYVNTIEKSGSGQTKTKVDGLFSAGDVVDSHYQQAATASGMGVKAAMDADSFLSKRE